MSGEEIEKVTKLAVFKGQKIRRVIHKGEWWFSVVDVISVLTDSEDPRNYWKVLKHRLLKEGADQTVTNCNQLKMTASDGKMRLTAEISKATFGMTPYE